MSLTKSERLKTVAYAAENMYSLVKNGKMNYEEGQKTVMRYMDMAEKEGINDILDFFKPNVSGVNKIAENHPEFEKEKQEQIWHEYREEIWKALEYFDLI